MSEKTEEKIAKEREAVDAMRNAKANMTGALDRIATLEAALSRAIQSLSTAKRYIAPDLYPYRSEKSARDQVDEAIAHATKLLTGN